MESQIDLRKHVPYSPLMEKIIREHLKKKYEGVAAEQMWKKVQRQYADFLKDLPYLGGKKNTHNGTGGTCANADICDYWIVGDESEAAKAHPKKTDDKGYWYND